MKLHFAPTATKVHPRPAYFPGYFARPRVRLRCAGEHGGHSKGFRPVDAADASRLTPELKAIRPKAWEAGGQFTIAAGGAR